jgi:Sugar kinases, ribokinase family
MVVIGLGTIAMDIVMQVDTLPKEDGFGVIKSTNYFPGGSGTNVIVQASRLGAQCGYIAQIGDDAIGKDICKSLQDEKINTDAMLVKAGGTSLHTNIVVDDEGKKFILLNMGDSFLSMSSSDIEMNYIKSANIFYTDLLPGEPAITALKAAKAANLETAFNMQVGLQNMEGFGVSRVTILEALKYVDVFAPCRDSLYALTGTTDLKGCNRYIRKYFDGVLLITLGAEGSAAFDKNSEILKIPVLKTEVVDTTGAGDSYMGSFIYAYMLKKMDLKAAMNFATACAAYTCKGLGARSAPTLSEAEEFIKNYSL